MKKKASGSVKKYSRNCEAQVKLRNWRELARRCSMTHLVKEELGLGLPQDVSEGLSDLVFTAWVP